MLVLVLLQSVTPLCSLRPFAAISGFVPSREFPICAPSMFGVQCSLFDVHSALGRAFSSLNLQPPFPTLPPYLSDPPPHNRFMKDPLDLLIRRGLFSSGDLLPLRHGSFYPNQAPQDTNRNQSGEYVCRKRNRYYHLAINCLHTRIGRNSVASDWPSISGFPVEIFHASFGSDSMRRQACGCARSV